MKKSYVMLIIFLVIYLVVVLPLILFLEKAKIEWRVILLEFSVIFLVLLLWSVFSITSYRKIIKEFNNGNYQLALVKGIKFLKYNKIGLFKENVCLIVSIIYFTMDNDIGFIKNIGKIKSKSMYATKLYWITINNIINEDLVNANMSFSLLKETPIKLHKYFDYGVYYDILSTLLSFYNEDKTVDKEMLILTKAKVKNEKVRSLFDKIIKNYEEKQE